MLAQTGVAPEELAAIGITNQRETTIVWDRETGRPVSNAIVWQCRRTAPLCEELKADGAFSAYVQEHTGLLIDAYFSATKLKWILDHVEGAREKAERGELLFGTVDSWLVWKLTGGAVHITDVTNASRTMLLTSGGCAGTSTSVPNWASPRKCLPQVRDSSQVYGTADLLGAERSPSPGWPGTSRPPCSARAASPRGRPKNTYGTGCFLLMNTGDQLCRSRNGLLTTVAVGLDGKVEYALEGSVFVGGAVIQWVRDELRFIGEARDAEYYASKVPDTGGRLIWSPPSRAWEPPTGTCTPGGRWWASPGGPAGTTSSGRPRSPSPTRFWDLADAMEKDTGISLKELNADGGASRDSFLMQFQSDILNKPVCRPKIRETTALGAAYLAGLAVGF